MRVEAEAGEGSFLPRAGKANTSARGMRSGVAEPRESQYGHDEPEGRRSSGNGCPHEDPSEGMVSCLVWCCAHEGKGEACTVARGITPRNGVNTLFPQFAFVAPVVLAWRRWKVPNFGRPTTTSIRNAAGSLGDSRAVWGGGKWPDVTVYDCRWPLHSSFRRS